MLERKQTQVRDEEACLYCNRNRRRFSVYAGRRRRDLSSRLKTMIVPFPAGGPTDVLARILAEAMRNSLGEPIVIEGLSCPGV